MSINKLKNGQLVNIPTGGGSTPSEYYKTSFIGTQAEWAALTLEEKAHYNIVNITDDLETEPVTLNISTDITRLYEAEVTITDGEEEIVKNLSSSGTLTVQLHNIGTYTISCDIYEGSINVSRLGITMAYEIGPEIVSWSEGTDAQIAKLIQSAYLDDIDLYDDAGWRVGDERTVSLAAMAATGVNETHHAQDVTMVILDFNHDNLATSINGHNKALITIQQKHCLMDENCTPEKAGNNGQTNTEAGYMNSTRTNVGSWKNSARRTWCNNVYYNAIPSSFKTLIKDAVHITTTGNGSTSTENTTDKVFFISEYEATGSVKASGAVEGSRYSYYNTTSNFWKGPAQTYHSGLGWDWWFRSPSRSYTDWCFAYMRKNQVTDNDYPYTYMSNANNDAGIAPAMCL